MCTYQRYLWLCDAVVTLASEDTKSCADSSISFLAHATKNALVMCTVLFSCKTAAIRRNVARRWFLRVTIGRCIAALCLGFLCFLMTGCGGGASATTTPPPPPPGAGVFQFSSSSLDFGSVNVGSNKALTISLSNTGGSSLTVTQLSMSSAVFVLSGVTLPLNLNAGQSVTGTITFTPSSSGSASGTLTATVNSATAGTLNLTGSGATPPPPPPPPGHSVGLSWSPSSSSGVVSYNIYRSGAASGPYTKIGNATATTFTDSTVQAGQTYFYTLTAVDGSNVESATSPPVSATIPTP